MTPPEITLRDWFAGQALAGWAAGRNRDTQQTSGAPDYIARTSYGYADAMIAERERREEKEAKDDEEASRKAREWVKAAGLKVAPHTWGGLRVMDGNRTLGTGRDIAKAVADAKSKLATDPTPLAPDARPAPCGASGGSGGSGNDGTGKGFHRDLVFGDPQPAPSTPTREDDVPDTIEKVARMVDGLDLSDVPTPDPKAFAEKLRAATKQRREDDEAWAHARGVLIYQIDAGWRAVMFNDLRVAEHYACAPTIHAAFRALRAKVEGGAR